MMSSSFLCAHLDFSFAEVSVHIFCLLLNCGGGEFFWYSASKFFVGCDLQVFSSTCSLLFSFSTVLSIHSVVMYIPHFWGRFMFTAQLNRNLPSSHLPTPQPPSLSASSPEQYVCCSPQSPGDSSSSWVCSLHWGHFWCCMFYIFKLRLNFGDSPGGPVVKNPSCSASNRFSPWSGN